MQPQQPEPQNIPTNAPVPPPQPIYPEAPPPPPAAPQPLYPEVPPAGPTTPPSAPPKKSKLLRTLIIALIILLLAGGAYAYYNHKNNKKTDIGGSASVCIPTIATDLTQAAATDEFKQFAQAVKTNNQACADELSSDFFIANSKDTFGDPSGKWIAFKNPINGQSMQGYFKQLPDTLSDSSFTQADYTRAIVVGKSYPSATGIKLSYPIDLSKLGGTSKNQVSISFVLDKNQVRVDDLVIEPQQ